MLENIVKRITREILRMVTLIRLVWILNTMRVQFMVCVQVHVQLSLMQQSYNKLQFCFSPFDESNKTNWGVKLALSQHLLPMTG